jgi:hypothetical protein
MIILVLPGSLPGGDGPIAISVKMLGKFHVNINMIMLLCLCS